MGLLFQFQLSPPWTSPSSLLKLSPISYLLLVFAQSSDSNTSPSHSVTLLYRFSHCIATRILVLGRGSIIAPFSINIYVIILYIYTYKPKLQESQKLAQGPFKGKPSLYGQRIQGLQRGNDLAQDMSSKGVPALAQLLIPFWDSSQVEATLQPDRPIALKNTLGDPELGVLL